MEARIKKIGDSLALEIPQSVARQIKLEADSTVTLTIHGRSLTISPVGTSGGLLEELLAGITEDNLHGEVDSGPAVGKEVW